MAAFVFILARPKAHYLVPFVLYQGMGLATFFLMVGRHLALAHSFDPIRVKTVTTIVCAVLCGVIFGHNVSFQNGLPLLINVRSAALQMQSYSFGAPGNNAIVTAIQASNIPTAFYHALQTSRSLHWESVATVLPPNHYNYAYDGTHAYTHRYHAVSLSDLQEMHDQVFFWTTRTNFAQHEWRQPIEAVWQDIRVADFERLSQLEALAIQERFDARLPPEKNAARGWTISACTVDAVCLGFAADPVDRKVVSHLRFLADSDQFAGMPERWRLEASRNGRDWQTIENFVDHRAWTGLRDIDWPPNYKRLEDTRQSRVYRLNNERFYPYYRLVFPQDRAIPNKLPGYVIAYSSGGCAPNVRVLPIRSVFVGKGDSILPGIDIISGRFWEETAAFPKTLASARVSLAPRKYLLGTGDDGEKGRDSWARMPRSWVLEGSKDGKRWDVLDRQEAVPQWQSNEVRSFGIKSNETFSQFRLVVNRTSEPGVVRIYEFRIEGDSLQAGDRLLRKGTDVREFYERRAPFPITLQTEFEQPTPVSAYRLDVGPYGKDSIERMPKNWRLLGSADGETWQLADTQNAQSGWKNGEQRAYTPSAIVVFKYLRLEVGDVASPERVFRLSSIRYFTPRTKATGRGC